MDLTVRPIRPSEVLAFRHQIARGFGETVHDVDSERFTRVFELPRMIAAFEGDAMVGSCGTFTFDVTVPGGTLPMGGTTLVTVLPTHRRRGVLTAMMRAQIDESRERGEPLSGLWASETTIYGRYGYGLAAEASAMQLDASTVSIPAETAPGRCRFIEPPDASNVLPAIYDRVRVTRPGMLTRHADWWQWRFIDDPEHRRGGATPRRFVVHEGTDGPDGYVIYRQKEQWDQLPKGTVTVTELVAATHEAHAGLWRYLLNIDLFPLVSYENLPTDDELPWRVTDHRRVRCTPYDTLWLRLLDIPRALSERTYDAPGRLVVGVTDPFVPDNDGVYALDLDGTSGRCTRTDETPDLTMPADALGAIYLGGVRPSLLARTGRIQGRTDAIARADRIFAPRLAPWCPEMF